MLSFTKILKLLLKRLNSTARLPTYFQHISSCSGNVRKWKSKAQSLNRCKLGAGESSPGSWPGTDQPCEVPSRAGRASEDKKIKLENPEHKEYGDEFRKSFQKIWLVPKLVPFGDVLGERDFFCSNNHCWNVQRMCVKLKKKLSYKGIRRRCDLWHRDVERANTEKKRFCQLWF